MKTLDTFMTFVQLEKTRHNVSWSEIFFFFKKDKTEEEYTTYLYENQVTTAGRKH